MILPPEAHPLFNALVFTFTNPTFQRLSTILVAAVLTTGRRTVTNLFRTLRHLAPGHRTSYQQVLTRAPWSGLALGRARARFLLDHFVPDGPVAVVGDDTVDGHRGEHVQGRARHRDPVRSTRPNTTQRCPYRQAVLAILVKFPFATPPAPIHRHELTENGTPLSLTARNPRLCDESLRPRFAESLLPPKDDG